MVSGSASTESARPMSGACARHASGVTTKEETRQAITDDYVPVGARSLAVVSAAGFRRGDTEYSIGALPLGDLAPREGSADRGRGGQRPRARLLPARRLRAVQRGAVRELFHA